MPGDPDGRSNTNPDHSLWHNGNHLRDPHWAQIIFQDEELIRMINSRKILDARNLFESIIKKHEAYDGQICICTQTFRRELQIPILNMIKQLEEAAE